MPGKPVFTASAADIRSWLKAGQTYAEIAARFGVTSTCVGLRARRLGVASTDVLGFARRGNVGGRASGFRNEESRILPSIRQIKAHFEVDDWRLVDIARHYGVTPAAVTKAITRAGYHRRSCAACTGWFLASNPAQTVCGCCEGEGRAVSWIHPRRRAA